MSDTFYRALVSRDSRFDGVFFVGVTTTGIYCRPVCTARTPHATRCVFFSTRTQAEAEGFRACFRCRPELAPGNAPVDAVPRLVDHAVRRIEQGALNGASVDALAAELGVTGRHLRRAMTDGLGVSPVELAQAARLQFAKRLLQDSTLPLADLAFAAGFQSVRRFNAAFRAHYGRAPSSLKRERGASRDVVLRLDYRPPLAWDALLGFLAFRAIPGVEAVTDGSYHRTVELDGKRGWVSVTREPARDRLIAIVSGSLLGALMPLVAKLRSLFDLDAHPAQVDAVLKRHPALKARVQKRPGLRVPGSFDGFETAVRAVLGQQISVKGATTLAGRLVHRFGRPLANAPAGLTHVFPRAAELAKATEDQVAKLGMPGARANALIGLAAAMANGLELGRGAPVEETMNRLKALPGIGEWTAQYLAMRALSWPDAFPASDLGVLKALNAKNARESSERAEAFRPWRAYATLHLWS
ncbi:MAG: DNA-3-methyladenine glycosylase 2 family protein [Archangiaceae bacterium]|nr:DNA-3-methyladenine glycosylase 2 family protein [Archangiaceae bacterium]